MPPKFVKDPSLIVAGLLLAGLVFTGVVRAPAQVPDARPAGYVSDFAGVISPRAKQQLEALATELNRKTGSQLAVVTVQSLQGKPVEGFSLNLATRWSIGRTLMSWILVQSSYSMGISAHYLARWYGPVRPGHAPGARDPARRESLPEVTTPHNVK